MKATQKTYGGMIARALREARIFYFCGPDEAGASEAATRLAKEFPDSEKVELAGADLRRDPVRLADEARSTSLFGEKRVIHVRCQGDDAHDAVATLLTSPVDGWPVLIVASGATDKSRIAKLLADRPDALVTIFHPPDARSVASMVRSIGESAGLRMTDELAERIARATMLDIRMARSEIDKLALYLDASPESPRTADGAALDAIGAVSEDDGMMPLVNVVLGGDTGRLAGELARMRGQDINPVGLLLACERRANQLAQLAGRLGSGTDINGFLEAEIQSRRLFFRDKQDLGQQLRRWRGKRLERLLERLIALHRAILADSRNGEVLLAQGLTEITRAAAR